MPTLILILIIYYYWRGKKWIIYFGILFILNGYTENRVLMFFYNMDWFYKLKVLFKKCFLGTLMLLAFIYRFGAIIN